MKSKHAEGKNKTLLEVGENETKMLEFDDGSFIVLSNELVELPNVSLFSNEEGVNGKSYYTDLKKEYWGIYKTMEAHLITYFTLYKTYITRLLIS